jgi:hypothetical protein
VALLGNGVDERRDGVRQIQEFCGQELSADFGTKSSSLRKVARDRSRSSASMAVMVVLP